MAAQPEDQFAISVRVTSIEKPADSKKDTNYTCKISIETTHGKWTLNRSFKDFEIFHANLVINDNFRGLNFPKIPARKNASAQQQTGYAEAKMSEYTQYLSEVLHRSILLGSADILDFIQSPEKVRRAAKAVMNDENVPVKSGQMKKEGEKWKGYRSRFFVLLPNYLLQYFETKEAYQIGIQPKGSIDLTQATKILVYDKTSNPFSMGIKCPERVWKLQCDTEGERDEWVQSLRNLLQNPKYTGYIADYAHSNDAIPSHIAHKVTVSENQPQSPNSPKENSDDTSHLSKIEDQDAQIGALQRRMQSLMARSGREKDELKDEVASEYRQQLDLQRETMLKWKEKITELSDEITSIESDRVRAETEHEAEVKKIIAEKEKLERENTEKDLVIAQTQSAVTELGVAVKGLEREMATEREKLSAMEGALSKVQGDAVSKMKYAKVSGKRCFFVGRPSNHLFYFDEGKGNGKGEQKFVVVKDVSVNNAVIEKQMKGQKWFLVLGLKRCALFAAKDEATRDAWVKFIKQALGKEPVDNFSGGFTPALSPAASPSSGNDEKSNDE